MYESNTNGCVSAFQACAQFILKHIYLCCCHALNKHGRYLSVILSYFRMHQYPQCETNLVIVGVVLAFFSVL